MAKVWIDGVERTVRDGGNFLQECLSLGYDLPYFCWHPAMGSVGACRQCAVKQFRDEHDARGRIVMACMTPAKDGARISIEDAEAREFRASIIEWLMVNHPHDCPVCDEGGECHLQDMTVLTGHAYRRYRGLKRTFRNQDLGPFVTHEMNRCIQCYRCVRYYREYAGGHDLDAHAIRDHVYFGRQADGVLESEFAGNLVEVCPTGVFTDKSLAQHYTRKWDLQNAPSVCVHCGVGCNTIPGERYGAIRRVHTRYHGEVNGYFLCDRGRYGYEFVNASSRIRAPLVRQKRASALRTVARDEALEEAARALRGAKMIGIGSPRASLEANFALRTLVGADRFHLGLSARDGALVGAILDILQNGPARTPGLREMERADAVLVLGEDVTNTAPMMALALRQSPRQTWIETAAKQHIASWDDHAVRRAAHGVKAPFYIAALSATRLDDVARRVTYAPPQDIARLGGAIAHAIDAGSPVVHELDGETHALADEIARALSSAQRPLVVSGTGCGSVDVIRAAGAVSAALCAAGRKPALAYAVPECNSLGLMLMRGRPLDEAMRAIDEGAADTVVILENDLYRRAPAHRIDALLDKAKHVVAIDHTQHATTARADFVLPAGTYAESDGTLVSSEGRAQRYFQVYAPRDAVQESWRWLRDIMAALGRERDARWANLDDVTAACSVIHELSGLVRAAPPADFRIAGQKIAREPHRYSGRTAMHANLDVHEPRPPADPDSALAYSMEGFPGEPPAALIPYYWAPHWNSIQSVYKFQQEVGGAVRGGDPGVRLIDPRASAGGRDETPSVPDRFEPRSGEWLVVPLHHIFGSEELSALAEGIRELAPKPYLALNPDDARALALDATSLVDVRIDGRTLRLPVRLQEALRRGMAGLPAGLPDLAGLALPAYAPLSKAAP
jgi:NADH-quinone oxidoreductase subunit G